MQLPVANLPRLSYNCPMQGGIVGDDNERVTSGFE